MMALTTADRFVNRMTGRNNQIIRQLRVTPVNGTTGHRTQTPNQTLCQHGLDGTGHQGVWRDIPTIVGTSSFVRYVFSGTVTRDN